jgi:APA family basic amino acid/polyamine antiporter
MPSSLSAHPRLSGLLPALGFFSTTMLVAGGVIGSGIFRKPGVMAAQLGSPTALLGIWVVAGVMTLLGALSTAELAGAIPETGGTYVYFERLYGPFAAFLYGWATFVVIQTGSITAVCYVFAEHAAQLLPITAVFDVDSTFRIHLPYLGDIVPLRDLGVKMIAACVIAGLTFVNYLGVKFGGVLQNVVTLIKVSTMVGLVLLVFLPPSSADASGLVGAREGQPAGWAWWAACAAALQGAFWAYDGWNKVTYIAGEVKEPQTNLPRALLWGMGLVTLLYVAMNVAYAQVLTIDEMSRSKLVAADVAERCLTHGGRWIAVAVMISTFGAANAIILASARVYLTMAERGVFPAVLGRIHPRFHTPGAALLAQGFWGVILLFSGTFDMLTDTLIFVSWIFYAAAAWGVILLRRREPDLPRPYRVPGYPWVPAVFIAFAVLYLVLTLRNDVMGYQEAAAAGRPALINSLFGLVLVLAGTPIYWFYRRRNKQTPTESEIAAGS